MGLGAIVAVGFGEAESRSTAPSGVKVLLQPPSYFDVLGCSVLERVIQRFIQADAEVVSVLAPKSAASLKPFFQYQNVQVEIVSDLNPAIDQKLKDYSLDGIEHTFLVSDNVYAETDLLDLFYFHREARQAVTRTTDREGRLDLWVIDCAKAQSTDLAKELNQARPVGSSYFIREYVNRLNDPRDLRRFASDMLQGRCAVRPQGRQIKRGVWIDEGAEVHRRARLVAPAYVGRASKVMEDTLITRCSNVERDCCVDYGTVIEESSILENTHIGICLDVCHAVASANKLLSVGRNVVVEISDPSLMRANTPLSKDSKLSKNGFLFSRRRKNAGQQNLSERVVEFEPAGSAPEPLGVAPIPYRSERNA